MSIIGINNKSNLKYRKILSIIVLSNIAQPYPDVQERSAVRTMKKKEKGLVR
jgi:hypothetical protein